MDSAIKNKLQSLLRLGLVSQSNVRRAMTLFQDPERYAKSPAYRTLMQEILVDVVDKIVNNRVLYTALRSSLGKDKANHDTAADAAATSTKLGESTETDRTNSLLRSGLVDKSEIAVARKAFKSPQAALRMSSVKAYREMMVGLMDSMLRKITGNPALFNAFKRTMGKETVEESFEYANSETISLCELHESAAETLAENKPTNTKLWSEAKTNARRAFTEYPSPCASGWAVKWYNEQGGDWASIAEGKSFFQFAKTADDSVITEFRTRGHGYAGASPQDQAAKEAEKAHVAKLHAEITANGKRLDAERAAAQARQTFVNHPAYKPPTRTGLPETPEQQEASREARIAALRASQTKKPVQEENTHTNKIDLQGEEMTTYLAVIHSAQIYRSRILSIVKNYKKKLKSGKYNPELAVKGFVYAVEDGLAERTKQTGVKMRLSGEQKLKVARELLDYYSDEIGEDMVKEGYEKKLRRLQNASDRAGLGTPRRTRLTKAAFDMENKSDAAKAVRTGDAIGGSNDFRKAVHKFNRIAAVKREAIRGKKAMAEETEEVVEKNAYGDFIDAYGKKIPPPQSKLSKLKSKVGKIVKKVIGEESEQLDELSKPTLARYIKKANQDSGRNSWKAGALTDKEFLNNVANVAARRKAAIRAMKRDKGIGRAADKLVAEESEQLDERGAAKLGRVMGAKYDAYQRGDWKKHSRLTGVASKLQSRVDSARVRRAGGSPEAAAQDSPRDANGKITPQSTGNYRAHRKALRKFTSNAQKRTSWAAKGRDGTLE